MHVGMVPMQGAGRACGVPQWENDLRRGVLSTLSLRLVRTVCFELASAMLTDRLARETWASAMKVMPWIESHHGLRRIGWTGECAKSDCAVVVKRKWERKKQGDAALQFAHRFGGGKGGATRFMRNKVGAAAGPMLLP